MLFVAGILTTIWGATGIGQLDSGCKGDYRGMLTADSTIFTGVCVDTACSLGFCAEHAAVAEMLKARQSNVRMIVAVNKDGAWNGSATSTGGLWLS
jgi:hypothetical protein